MNSIIDHSLKKKFFADGSVVIRNCLSDADLAPLRERILDVFSLAGFKRDLTGSLALSQLNPFLFNLFLENPAQFIGCATQVQHLIETHRLGLHDKILNLLKELGLVFPNISTRPVLAFHHPKLAKDGNEKYWKTPAHQDWRSIQGSLNSVVVWFPLVQLAGDMGLLEFIPGSHRLGLLETEKTDWYRRISDPRMDESKFQEVQVNEGDLLLFSTFLVHRSGNNTSESVRYSLQFRYNDLAEESFKQRNMPNPYIYEPIQELLTPGFPTVQALDDYFTEKE